MALSDGTDIKPLNEPKRQRIDAGKGEQIGIDAPHVAGQQLHAYLVNGRAVNADGSVIGSRRR